MGSHIWVVALLVACGSTAESAGPLQNQQVPVEAEAEEPPPTVAAAGAESAAEVGVVDGFFSAEGAPSPSACESPIDCLGDTIPDVNNPCCNDPRSLRPHSRAYRRWVGEWRAAECESVQCPPPPNPSMPEPCSFQMQCIDGVCANEC